MGSVVILGPYWNPMRRMFGVWAAIVLVGFFVTHFDQSDRANWMWFALSVAGLAYMKRLLPFGDPGSRSVFLLWFGVIVLGMALSFAAFRVPAFTALSGYLGVLWLLLMAAGHALTGVLDGKRVYALTAGVQAVVAGLVYWNVGNALMYEYLVAGSVGAFAMAALIRYA